MQKPKRRDRYIAFEFGDAHRAREVSSAFHAALSSWPREDRPSLVFIERARGLARCGHLHKDDVIRLLNGLRIGNPPLPVRTVGTSGTIRAARSRYFAKP